MFVTHEAFSRGLLSMVNRGLLPPDSDLSNAFVGKSGPLLAQAPVRLKPRQEQVSRLPIAVEHNSTNFATVKFDLVTPIVHPSGSSASNPQSSGKLNARPTTKVQQLQLETHTAGGSTAIADDSDWDRPPTSDREECKDAADPEQVETRDLVEKIRYALPHIAARSWCNVTRQRLQRAAGSVLAAPIHHSPWRDSQLNP